MPKNLTLNKSQNSNPLGQNIEYSLNQLVDGVNQLIRYQKLIELAIAQIENNSSETSKTLILLLEIYQSGSNCFIDEISASTKHLHKQLTTPNLITHQDSKISHPIG